MPEIGRFFGIVIRMFAEPGTPHRVPHFHAYYPDDVGIFSFDPVELIAGSVTEETKAARGSLGKNCIKLLLRPIGQNYRRDVNQRLLSLCGKSYEACNS